MSLRAAAAHRYQMTLAATTKTPTTASAVTVAALTTAVTVLVIAVKVTKPASTLMMKQLVTRLQMAVVH